MNEGNGGILEPVEPPNAEPFPPYLIRDAVADVQKMGEGIPSGFDELDTLGFKWRPGKLYAVMARPNHGKTTFLLETLMRHAETIQEGQGPAVFVTYEEHRAEVLNRILRREVARERTHIFGIPGGPTRDIVAGWLRMGGGTSGPEGSERHLEDLIKAGSRLDQLGNAGRLVIIDGDQSGEDGGGLDVDDLTRKLRQESEAAGLPPSLVVVDYYQKVRPPAGYRGESRQAQLQAIVDTFRRYAKGQKAGEPPTPEYAVPVIVGAQVNRETVTAEKPRQPELHHAREADDLANDAAGVLTLLLEGEEHPGTLSVKAVKNRDGKRSREAFELAFYGGFNLVAEKKAGEGQGVIV